MKSGFRRTVNWKKCQSELSTERPDEYLDYLIDPSFQGVNRLFVLSYGNNAHRTRHTGYFFLIVEIKEYDVTTDGKNLFDQPVKNDLRTDENVRKNAIGQGDDYTTGYLLDYP